MDFEIETDVQITGVAAGDPFNRAAGIGIDIGPNQTTFGRFGETINYVVRIVNNQTVADYIDITAQTGPSGWSVSLFYIDGITLLHDSPADSDGIPDTGLLAVSAYFDIIVRVKIPHTEAFNVPEVTLVTAISSLSPAPHVGTCKLVTNSYPHLDATKSVSKVQIYEKAAASVGFKDSDVRTRVTLNIKGGGIPTTYQRFHDVVFLIDNTGSMLTNDPTKKRLAAANSYVNNMTEPDQGAVVTFYGTPTITRGSAWLARAPPSGAEEHLSSDYRRLKDNINWTGNYVNGGTNILKAMQVGINELISFGNPDNIWYMILLTDGYDSGNVNPGDRDGAIRTEAQNAANNNIVVFTIGLGNLTNVQLLKDIAATTNGEYYSAQNASQLMEIYNEIKLAVSKVAGRDLNPYDNEHMVREVLPPYIEYVEGSFRVEPGSIDFEPHPSRIESNVINTTLYWDIDRILVNESWLVSFEVTSSEVGWVPVGVYPDSRIRYTDWSNITEYNLAFPEVWIEVLPIPRPDIIPLEVMVNDNLYDPQVPVEVLRGEKVTISSKVKNQGILSTGQFASMFDIGFFNASQPGTPFFSSPVDPLDVNEISKEFSSVWYAPFSLMEFELNVVVDWQDAIPEGSAGENNNKFRFKIKVVHYPVIDLIPVDTRVDDYNLSTSQPNVFGVKVKSETKIELQVQNNGNENSNYFASSFYIALFDKDLPNGVLATSEINSLAAGSKSQVIVFLWNAPANPGIFDLEIVVDSTNAINEGISGELNNRVPFTFKVMKETYIDLVPNSLYIGDEKQFGKEDLARDVTPTADYDLVIGQQTSISFSIYSIANEPSMYFSQVFSIILFNDTTSAGKYFYRADIMNIDPQTSSDTFIAGWRAPVEPGTYSITISIDHFDSIFEENGGEDNNLIKIDFNVFGLLEPPDLNLEKGTITPDITLSWNPVDNASYYQVFGGSDPYDFDLSKPLVTTDQNRWTDISVIDSSRSYFYTIRSLDVRGWSGPTGAIIGFYTLQFTKGYNSFSLPLEPFITSNASWYADEMFSQDFETIYEYNTEHDQWIGHPKFLPAGMDDFKVVPGKGYMIYSSRDFNYTFTGRPETFLRFVESVAGDNWLSGDPADDSFMQSLSLNLRQSGVLLQWSDIKAGGEQGKELKYYEIHRTAERGDLAVPTSGPLDGPAIYSELIATTRLNRFIDSNALKMFESELDGGSVFELHYIVVPVDELGRRGSSTYSVSISASELDIGYNSFGFTLIGTSRSSAFDFIDKTGELETDTIYYYHRGYQSWIGHPGFLPEFRDNPDMLLGEGYLVFILADSGRSIYFTT